MGLSKFFLALCPSPLSPLILPIILAPHLYLHTGEALRPVLTKIIPMKLLSKMKAGIINNATDKLSADSIEKYEAGR